MNDATTVDAAVRDIIAECLGAEAEEVMPESNFFDDLGGESIDLLDMNYQIEKQLGIRVNFHQMFSSESWQFDEQGRLTGGTLEKLREEFPTIDIDQLGAAEGVPARTLLTVQFITEVVRSQAASG